MEEQCTAKESVVAGSPANNDKRKLKKTPTKSSDPASKKDSSSEERGDEKEKLEGDATEKGKNKKKKPSNDSRKAMRLSVASQLAKQKNDAKTTVGNIAPVLVQLTNISQKVTVSVTYHIVIVGNCGLEHKFYYQ